MKVNFHPAARRELLRQNRWYFLRSESAAAGFEHEVDHAISRIVEGPQRYPATLQGCRRFVLSKFPFSVIYRIGDGEIHIVAIAHHRRKPGYWISRAD